MQVERLQIDCMKERAMISSYCPTIPGLILNKNHWVLAVLNLKTTTCYYLNSLRTRSVDEQLRQIIDTATAVYASESGANIRVKLVWINARCPRQPGGTECGYYVMKFMKEIAYEGVEILDNDNVGK
ncbi:putative Ulp1 peptidase [Helianthus annuus]|nr:putative Ulp1 peptidase [Helianthus annuus]